MKERPILFSGPMVRALLAGTKTQTRRAVKPQPAAGQGMVNAGYCGDRHLWLRDGPCDETDPVYEWRCPYGRPGDRLWVRESWFPDPPADGTWGYTAWAGCREGQIAGVPDRFRHPRFCCYAADWLHGEVRWTPSIHMPRWASRMLLNLKTVRVERLQDISEADAIGEGIEKTAHGFWSLYGTADVDGTYSPRSSYRALWESINGPGSWDANPWVWVVEFERAQLRETDASGCKRTGTEAPQHRGQNPWQ